MFGFYDLDNNNFVYHDETNKAFGSLIVVYKGNLFLEREKEKNFLQNIAFKKLDFDIFKHLRGQFVFAIFDRNKKSLTLIRDQFGVIPLYYSIYKNKLFFGTTIKAILRSSQQTVNMNSNIIHEYFIFRYVSGENTFFDNIYELSPGFFLKVHRNGKLNKNYYYRLQYYQTLKISKSLASKLLEKAFWDSLKIQTLDKNIKNIAVLSSGGIDSSILVSCASKILKSRFNTYYIGYKNYKYNRITEVNYLAKIYNTNHTNFFISSEQFANSLIKTVLINEEPLNHPNTVARKCLYEFLQGKVDVLLSGEGADCFYCGYYIFDIMYYFYVKNPIRPLTRLFANMLTTSIFPQKYYTKLLKIKKALIFHPDEYTIFHDLLAYNSKENITNLLENKFPPDFAQNYILLFSNYSKKNILDITLHLYQTYYIVEALNTLAKLGNAYKIEHRHPFIDIKMIELFNQLPWQQKISFFKRKHQIIKLAKKYLPQEITKRPKEGFGVPLGSWFYDKKGLGEFISLLSDKKTRERGIYKTSYLDKLLKSYHKQNLPPSYFESIIWPIINLELWCRIFIDKDWEEIK